MSASAPVVEGEGAQGGASAPVVDGGKQRRCERACGRGGGTMSAPVVDGEGAQGGASAHVDDGGVTQIKDGGNGVGRNSVGRNGV
eukprot:70965-Chlamydomonas_euryale.AAC.1